MYCKPPSPQKNHVDRVRSRHQSHLQSSTRAAMCAWPLSLISDVPFVHRVCLSVRHQRAPAIRSPPSSPSTTIKISVNQRKSPQPHLPLNPLDQHPTARLHRTPPTTFRPNGQELSDKIATCLSDCDIASIIVDGGNVAGR
jgi:hypothetical protein